MWEVEQQFSYTKEHVEIIARDALYVGTQEFTDVYFDKKDYHYTKRDMWLRRRSGRFELKVGEGSSDGVTSQYLEIEEEHEIARRLGISSDRPLVESLEGFGLFPFISWKTTRVTYHLGAVHIDFDTVMHSEGYGYTVGEVEVLVERPEDRSDAETQLQLFMKKYQLSPAPELDKMTLFLQRYAPEHLRALGW